MSVLPEIAKMSTFSYLLFPLLFFAPIRYDVLFIIQMLEIGTISMVINVGLFDCGPGHCKAGDDNAF